jgi:hypothetical protein
MKGAIAATQKLANQAFDAPCTSKTPIVVHEFMQGAVGNELERLSASLHLAILLQRPLVIAKNTIAKSGPCAGKRAVPHQFKWFDKYSSRDLLRQSASCQQTFDAKFCQWDDKDLRVQHKWGGLDMDGGGWPREYGSFPSELKKSFATLKAPFMTYFKILSGECIEYDSMVCPLPSDPNHDSYSPTSDLDSFERSSAG